VQTGVARVQAPEGGCQSAVGTWKHQSGGNWTFGADGSMEVNSQSAGRWICEGGSVVKLTWIHGNAIFVGTTDTITVASDRTHMSTTNVY